MFTGIIEALGIARGYQRGRRCDLLEVEVAGLRQARRITKGLKVGGSVCVNGACLTVTRKKGRRVYFNIVNETRRRTALGDLRAGERVNLERSLKAGERIEGHIVLGHVDGVGRIAKVAQRKDEKSFWVRFPKSLRPYLVEKGSIAVNGVSLTLGRVSNGGFWTHCIPHTLKFTNLGALKKGAPVNLEADILAKLARG